MATITPGVNGVYQITLAAGTADQVSSPAGRAVRQIEVVNLTGTAAIYFTLDGTAPTVGNGDGYEVPAGALLARVVEVSGRPTVRLISSGAPQYSITFI